MKNSDQIAYDSHDFKQCVVEHKVIECLEQTVNNQSIELQQALNHRRIEALAKRKFRVPKMWTTVACSLTVAWFASSWLIQDQADVYTDIVALNSDGAVFAMVQDVPQIELEALEHTDFLLWMAESTSDLPST
jgi:hypothetical protein